MSVVSRIASYLQSDEVLQLRCLHSKTTTIHEKVTELRAAGSQVVVQIQPDLGQYKLIRQLLLNPKVNKKVISLSI